MRLHPVSWLLLGILAFVFVDAALQAAAYVAVWRNTQEAVSELAGGFMFEAFYVRVGDNALGSLAWTIGTIVWLEILWRTLRGLRLRRAALEIEGEQG